MPHAVAPHAVARLRMAGLSCPTRPGLDRRAHERPERCTGCRLIASHCMCALRRSVPTRAGICLVMAEFEPLRPSNTGWLVADVVPDTAAFAWSRLTVDPALPALLADPQWQPYVVFPGEFAAPERVVTTLSDPLGTPGIATRRPLFVLLDGTWSEACKIFRKSPYLQALPVLSLQPDTASQYRLRRSKQAHHLCTAEVAALCLALAGDLLAAQVLEASLAVFGNRYLQARQSQPHDPADAAHQRLIGLQGAAAAAARRGAGAHDQIAGMGQPAPRFAAALSSRNMRNMQHAPNKDFA